jgi:hypothetical protein
MSPELDSELCKKYPKIFANRHGDMRSTAMCWGFECGDGWYEILSNACSLIQGHIDWSRKQRANSIKFNRALKKALDGNKEPLIKYHSYKGSPNEWTLQRVEEDIVKATFREVRKAIPQVVADQVKEKFGTLRFYVHGGDDYTDGVVSMAEAMSGVTCEVCGKPGTTSGGGWITTLCVEHRDKRNEQTTE